MTRLQRFPNGLPTISLKERYHPQRCPEFVQGAKNGGFGQLLAKLFLDLWCGEYAAALEQLPDVGNERRDTVSAGGAGCMLPVAITAEGVDERKSLDADEKIRMIAGGPQQVERQGRVRLDKPCEQIFCGFDGSAGRRGVGLAETGLNEGRRGRGNLCLAGKKKAEAGLLQPGLRVIEGEQRLGLLPPKGRARRE